jgi:hypothetical protein
MIDAMTEPPFLRRDYTGYWRLPPQLPPRRPAVALFVVLATILAAVVLAEG